MTGGLACLLSWAEFLDLARFVQHQVLKRHLGGGFTLAIGEQLTHLAPGDLLPRQTLTPGESAFRRLRLCWRA